MIIRNFIFLSLMGSMSLLSFANASSFVDDSTLSKDSKQVIISQPLEEIKEPPVKNVRTQAALEEKIFLRALSVVNKDLEITEKQEKAAREALYKNQKASCKIKMAEWQEKSAALKMFQFEKALVDGFVKVAPKSAFPSFKNAGIINPTTEEILAWVQVSDIKKLAALKELEIEFQEKKAEWKMKKSELEKLMNENKKVSFFSRITDILNKVLGLIKFSK